MALRTGRNALKIVIVDMDDLDDNGNPKEKVNITYDYLDGPQLVALIENLPRLWLAWVNKWLDQTASSSNK